MFFFYEVTLVILASVVVHAHTWIDCIDHDLDVVYTDSHAWVYGGISGRGLCEGYARGFPGQGAPDLSSTFTHLMDQSQVLAGTPVCQFQAQDPLNYGGWRTRVSAVSGDRLYFAYFPNGHVVKDKKGRGTQYGIYWSGDNPNNELVLTTDLPGHLLDNQLFDFDDGNCGETFEDLAKTIRSDRVGDAKPCIGSFVVPQVSVSGIYQFIYLWKFYPTDRDHVLRNGYFGAAYSSCFDIEITPTLSLAVSEPEAEPDNTSTLSLAVSEPEAEPDNTSTLSLAVSKPEATSTPVSHCDDPNGQLQCSPFWAPCYENGISYACTLGSTCITLNDHYSQCQPEHHPYDVQCNETGEKCPVGWTCSLPVGAVSGHCAPSDKQCRASDDVSAYSKAVAALEEEEETDKVGQEATHNLRSSVGSNTETTDVNSNSNSNSNSNQDMPSFTGTTTPTIGAKSSVTVTSVGGSGNYGRVVNMNPGVFGQACPSNQCVQQDTPVSGSLAPFNDEVSVSFRGPLILSKIAVYEPSQALSSAEEQQWIQVSSYDRDLPHGDHNLVFLNNKGDSETSGIWTPCGGNSQSFASADGTQVAKNLEHFHGVLQGNTEVSIMSSRPCLNQECGFTRGEAYHGWKGSDRGDKIFVIKAQMPTSHDGHPNLPAIWMLHSQVLRTAQYGCNCRGVGSTADPWKAGCGEFDVAEVLPTNEHVLTSTIYSFKGSRGTSGYAPRPTTAPVTFVVIFDSDQSGRIKVLILDEEEVDFNLEILSSLTVERWLEDQENVTEEHVTIDFDL